MKIQRDMTGDDVKYIQTSLNSLGNYNLVINGVFDSSTDSVVKSFQTANGLNPDGIVGPKTVATLEKKLESLSKPASSDLSMLETTIIETAQSFIGQKEISGNMGFKQPFFLRLMESIGWKKS